MNIGDKVWDTGDVYSEAVGDKVGMIIGIIQTPGKTMYRVEFEGIVETTSMLDALKQLGALGGGAAAGTFLYYEDELGVVQ